MSDSSSDAGDIYTLPSERISSHTITPKVSEALSQLCNIYSVKCIEFSHDPDDSSKLTILGENVERIPLQEIDELLEGTGFSATTQSSDSLHTDLFLNPTLTVTKKEWDTSSTNAHPWQAVEYAACEVMLHAVNRNKEEPHNERLAYFGGPAHMLLSKPQRMKYGQVGMVAEARQEVGKMTTRNRYIIQLQGSTDVPLDTGHPPLFCYNYWCCARTTSGCRSCMEFNDKLKSIKDVFAFQTAINEGAFDDIRICRHMILNDIFLLSLDVRQVHNLSAAFRERVQLNIGPMVKVTHIRQLRNISTHRLPIMIGNYPGQLVPMQMAYDRTDDPDDPRNPYCHFLGLHVAFTLDSEEHQLNPGDCGHIVFYKVNGEYQPLGMFIGKVPGRSKVYRSILMHQAITEMENDYPDHIRDVQLIDDNFLNGGEAELDIGDTAAVLDIGGAGSLDVSAGAEIDGDPKEKATGFGFSIPKSGGPDSGFGGNVDVGGGFGVEGDAELQTPAHGADEVGLDIGGGGAELNIGGGEAGLDIRDVAGLDIGGGGAGLGIGGAGAGLDIGGAAGLDIGGDGAGPDIGGGGAGPGIGGGGGARLGIGGGGAELDIGGAGAGLDIGGAAGLDIGGGGAGPDIGGGGARLDIGGHGAGLDIGGGGSLYVSAGAEVEGDPKEKAAGFGFSVPKVNFPSVDTNIITSSQSDVSTDLSVGGDAKLPSGKVKVPSGEVDLDLPELKASDVNLPSIDVSPEIELDASTPDIKAKGKKRGFKMPKFGFGSKADGLTLKYDPPMSDSSSDAGVDFNTSPSESISFHAITSKVSEALSQLCNDYSVKFIEFSHDPDDSTTLTIIGKNAEKIPQQEIDDCLQNTGFFATAHGLLEGTGFSARTQSSDSVLNPTLTLTRKEWDFSSTWKDISNATCEVQLHAVNLNKEEPHNERLAYFAGPAHMLLTKDQRTKYGQVDMVAEARWEVEKTTTNNRYIIQLQGSTDVPLDMGHPPLFCYNYFCCARTRARSRCGSCRNFNEKLSGIKDVFDLAMAYDRGDFDGITICRHMILNDLLLLTLDLTQGHTLYAAFRKLIQLKIGPMYDVQSIERLREISLDRSPIMIGNYPGKLAPMRIGYERTEVPGDRSNPYCCFLGLHVAFTLDSEEHQLKDGECGRIIFIKLDNGEYQPLGMFIGRVKGSSGVYRAILLHQAIEEMEHDYPHHIRDVQLIDDDFLNGGEAELNIGDTAAELDIGADGNLDVSAGAEVEGDPKEKAAGFGFSVPKVSGPDFGFGENTDVGGGFGVEGDAELHTPAYGADEVGLDIGGGGAELVIGGGAGLDIGGAGSLDVSAGAEVEGDRKEKAAGFGFSVPKVNFPSVDSNIITSPQSDVATDLSVGVDVKLPSGEVKVPSAEADLDLPELKASEVNLPSVDDSSEIELDASIPDIKAKGPKIGGQIDVGGSAKGPELDAKLRGSAKVDTPNLGLSGGLDASSPDTNTSIDADIPSPKAKCKGCFGLKRPKVKFPSLKGQKKAKSDLDARFEGDADIN